MQCKRHYKSPGCCVVPDGGLGGGVGPGEGKEAQPQHQHHQPAGQAAAVQGHGGAGRYCSVTNPSSGRARTFSVNISEARTLCEFRIIRE